MACKHLQIRKDALGISNGPTLEIQRELCLVRADVLKKQEIDEALKNTPYAVMISTEQCPLIGAESCDICPYYEPA